MQVVSALVIFPKQGLLFYRLQIAKIPFLEILLRELANPAATLIDNDYLIKIV